MAAIVAAGDRADVAMLPAMKQQLKEGPEQRFAKALEESIALIEIVQGDTNHKNSAPQKRSPGVAPLAPLQL